MALDLAVSHDEERDDDADPVQVVRDDRAVGGRVCPAKEGVEEAPAVAAVEGRAAALRLVSGSLHMSSQTTYIDVPHRLVDIIRPRAVAELGGVASDELVPGVLLKEPHGPREEAGGNEIQQTGRDDEEELQLGR